LGEKDFQQLLIIRKMISELNFPVQVKAIPTVRESDGLALSSRNSYLNALERQSAPLLYRSLCQAKDQLKNGRRDWAGIEKEQIETLEKAGFTVDFFSICSVEDLLPAANEHASWVILAAVMLGQTRLIDNIRVMRSEF
ncbi:MAG: 4-phosphopantoate--beta-alanine ligase, partial [Methylococcales bacterium]|nr:4-phosphopantoate--beta-alanine ligase [Methylococcales bacterium]